MLVLDVSNSMLAKDFTIGGDEATRLDAVREVTRKFIEARPNDRIGMIAFGTRPYIVSPMTLDHEWLLQNLDRVRIGLVEGSTAIGSAMAAAGNRLNDKQSKSRVVVLLTDGDNNAGKIPPNTAAEALKALRIHLYAIGIGTNGVAPFPVMDERTGRVVTDGRGNVYYQNAPVSFNETGLREVAQIADGKFYRATDYGIAGVDLSGHRQAGKNHHQRPEISTVPRPIPRVYRGRLWIVDRAALARAKPFGGDCRE